MSTDTKDDLGSEIPGEVWHTAMRFTGLAAARRIVELGAELDAARKEAERQHAETLRAERWGESQFDARRKAESQLDAARKEIDELQKDVRYCAAKLDAKTREADELRAQRDRAEALCQEHATLVKQLEERLRQATQIVDRSKLPTVPPRVGYRYERRDGTECEIVRDYGNGVAYRFAANDSRTYTTSGEYGAFRESHILDLVREIGPIEQGDKS